MDEYSDEHSDDFVPLQRYSSPYRVKPLPGPPAILISAPRSTGLASLIDRLLAKYADHFGVPRSYTTRPPNEDESGISPSRPHRFVDRCDFNFHHMSNDFAVESTHSEHFYGVKWTEIIQLQGMGKVLVIRAEPRDIDALKWSKRLELRCAFLVPPSLQSHEQKLRNEKRLSEQQIESRMLVAEDEVAYASMRRKTDLLLVNDDMQLAFMRLERWALDGIGQVRGTDEAN